MEEEKKELRCRNSSIFRDQNGYDTKRMTSSVAHFRAYTAEAHQEDS